MYNSSRVVHNSNPLTSLEVEKKSISASHTTQLILHKESQLQYYTTLLYPMAASDAHNNNKKRSNRRRKREEQKIFSSSESSSESDHEDLDEPEKKY